MREIKFLVYILGFSILLRGGITPELKAQLQIFFELVFYTWLFNVVNLFYPAGGLNYFGVRPRRVIGLFGIFSSPFLHPDWGHLFGFIGGMLTAHFLPELRCFFPVQLVN